MINTKQKAFALVAEMVAKDPFSKHTKVCAYGFTACLLGLWIYTLLSSGVLLSLLLAISFVFCLYSQVDRYAGRLASAINQACKPRIEDIRLLIVSTRSLVVFGLAVLAIYLVLVLSY